VSEGPRSSIHRAKRTQKKKEKEKEEEQEKEKEKENEKIKKITYGDWLNAGIAVYW
jgi:ribosomal protein L12E/L44/L45/RPP1/RPP2